MPTDTPEIPTAVTEGEMLTGERYVLETDGTDVRASTVSYSPIQAEQPRDPMHNVVSDDLRSRQKDLVDSEIFTNPITVIGAGAIGSFTTLTLAKMGFRNISVYDFDHVDTANISNQFYRYKDIGNAKVYALQEMVKDFENLDINVFNTEWARDITLKGHIIMAVDNMTVRNAIYKAIKRNADVFGFVDGRMGGQQGEVYSIDLVERDMKKIYEQYLWSEEEASSLPCTQKAVMYNVMWIASQIANNLRLMMEDKPFPPVMQMDFENVNHLNITHE